MNLTFKNGQCFFFSENILFSTFTTRITLSSMLDFPKIFRLSAPCLRVPRSRLFVYHFWTLDAAALHVHLCALIGLSRCVVLLLHGRYGCGDRLRAAVNARRNFHVHRSSGEAHP